MIAFTVSGISVAIGLSSSATSCGAVHEELAGQIDEGGRAEEQEQAQCHMGVHWAGLRTKDIGIPPSLWTDADANGLAKPRMTAADRAMPRNGKCVGANPSPIEGGYSPMTGRS
jgi:hypothetical protein